MGGGAAVQRCAHACDDKARNVQRPSMPPSNGEGEGERARVRTRAGARTAT